MAGRGRGIGVAKQSGAKDHPLRLPSTTMGNDPASMGLFGAVSGGVVGRGHGMMSDSSGVSYQKGFVDSQFSQGSAQSPRRVVESGDTLDSRQLYTTGTFSPFDPRDVTMRGRFYQSIQKYTENCRYFSNTKSVTTLTTSYGNSDQSGDDILVTDTVKSKCTDFEAPGSFPVPMTDPQVDLIRVVVLENVVGVNDFYIKPKRNFQYGILAQRMNAWYDENYLEYPPPPLKNLILGGHYVAYSRQDKKWFRVALQACKSNEALQVKKLDEMGTFQTTCDELRFIRKSFCAVPIQLIRAKLQLVPGPEWTEEENKLFKDEVEGETFSLLTITEEVKESTLIAGVILLQVNDGNICPYTFGGRLSYGYRFDCPKLPAVIPAMEKSWV